MAKWQVGMFTEFPQEPPIMGRCVCMWEGEEGEGGVGLGWVVEEDGGAKSEMIGRRRSYKKYSMCLAVAHILLTLLMKVRYQLLQVLH